ncbi:MAG: BCAM0308 family protein [Thermodesulfobacteriota bacterium]
MGKDTNIEKHGRGDRLLKELEHDPYMARHKPAEPTACPKCKVVFSGGRWQWTDTVHDGANEELCPACRRIGDKVPAGYLTLGGDFFEAHREEIMNLVRHKEESEKAAHPMKRLMDVEEREGGAVITFTDTHLPRGAGEAIQKAYEGKLEINYTKESNIVRVTWER